MPNQIIKERLSQLTPDYKTFVLSKEPSTITTSLAKAHTFDEDAYQTFENGFAMLLLFFIDKPTLKNYLVSDCGLKTHDAELLAEALILALPPDIRASWENTSNLIFNSNENPERNDDITREIAETEAALKSIGQNHTSNNQPIPTPEQTYTSTQSAILNEKMRPSNPSDSQWGDN